jgi:hypothetical protein
MKRIISFLLFISLFTSAVFLQNNPSSDKSEVDSVQQDVDDCRECFVSTVESCVEVDSSCLESEECVQWINCVDVCQQKKAEEECYTSCDDRYVESEEVNRDLKFCVCEMCWLVCESACIGS